MESLGICGRIGTWNLTARKWGGGEPFRHKDVSSVEDAGKDVDSQPPGSVALFILGS